MKTILIAEDDLNIQNILAFNLEKEGFKVFTVENGKEALEVVKEDIVDLILLDVMMPEMDGYDFIRKFREFSDIPVIMLTALESETNKLQGFELGADDYILKPFSIKEVIARINLQLHKMELISGSVSKMMENAKNLNVNELTIQDIVLDVEKHIVTREGKEFSLTEREYNIFMLFYSNSGKVYSREDLIKLIWGNEGAESRTVDVTINRLRQKVEKDVANSKIIKSRRGMGYYLELNGELS